MWPYVETGLARIREKGPVGWLNQEVYSCIYRGRAGLFVAMDDQMPRGFIVTEVRRDDQLSLQPNLHVWLLWAEGQEGNYADVEKFAPATVEFLDKHAKQLGINRITFNGRKGWSAFLKGYFEPVYVRFERNI